MKLLLAPYLISLLLFFPTALVIICKFLFLTKSSISYLGNRFSVITELFFQLSEFGFIGCIYFWIYFFFKKINLSTVILNVYFISFYFLLFAIALYDYQNGNFNSQNVLFSTLKAYLPIFKFPVHFSFPSDFIPRNNDKSLSFITDIIFAILDDPIFWSLLIIFFILFFSYCIYLIINYKFEICSSVYSLDSQNDLSCDYLIDPKSESNDNFDFNGNYFKIFHILGFLYLTFALCYSITPIRQRIVDISSFTTNFNILYSMSHYEKKLNPNIDLLNVSRRYLPKDRYWLDNRKDPIYPLVHGDINAFCAYNPTDSKCQNKTYKKDIKNKSKISILPNVYFMIIESFNPFSYLINDDFLDEQSTVTSADKKYYITDTPYYNDKILPNLAKYTKDGIVFSGMASQGLPTLSGLHSLLTGVPPSQTFMNIMEATDAHVDDFPSHFHDVEKYRSFFATSTDIKFDGFHLWLNRRSAEQEAKILLNCDDSSDIFNDQTQIKLMGKKSNLKKCNHEEINKLIEKKNIKSFPKWFDYIVGFFPNENQSKVLNLTEVCLKKTNWLSDRVLSKEIQLTWKQQKEFLKQNKIDKPLLGVTTNMETHIPYFGFDNPNQYDAIDPKISRFSSEHKKKRFLRVNKYMDKNYIGSMLDFLKKEDNNTIVVIVGDHGTRDIPIKKLHTQLTAKTQLSGDCYDKASGSDSLFITSGAILYLGDDQRVKEELKFDKLKGKTLKVATDHNDIVYTVLDTLSRIQDKPLPPTSRLGRNLIDFSDDIINTLNEGTSKLIQKLNDQDWQSISYLSYQIEYKRGAEFIRTHSSGPKQAHYYNVSSFPTCVKTNDAKDKKLGGKEAKRMFNEMVDYLNVQNYLLYHNRVFNYAFRNEKCIENGSCELPSKLGHIKLHDKPLFKLLFGFPLIMALITAVIIYIIRMYSSAFQEKKEIDVNIPDI